MPRIRTIKPEFWSSPGLPADPWERLLFIAMWNWADDYGIGSANERELLGFAFPNDAQIDAADLRRMLASVHRVFGVKFYTVAGRPYYAIPSWESHQKIDRRSARRNPGPDEAETWLYQDPPESPRDPPEPPPSSQRDAGVGKGTEDLGKGTEEEETCATPLRDRPPPRFDDFWDAYPRHRDRRKAERAFTAALRRADADTIIDGASRYATDPSREEQYTKYAEGWLNGDGWLDEPLPLRNNGKPVHKLRALAELAAETRAHEQAQLETADHRRALE